MLRAIIFVPSKVFSVFCTQFIGGPGSPGILVAKRSLFTNEVPTIPGGGTVDYVSPMGQQYSEDIESREDGMDCGILCMLFLGIF